MSSEPVPSHTIILVQSKIMANDNTKNKKRKTATCEHDHTNENGNEAAIGL